MNNENTFQLVTDEMLTGLVIDVREQKTDEGRSA